MDDVLGIVTDKRPSDAQEVGLDLAEAKIVGLSRLANLLGGNDRLLTYAHVDLDDRASPFVARQPEMQSPSALRHGERGRKCGCWISLSVPDVIRRRRHVGVPRCRIPILAKSDGDGPRERHCLVTECPRVVAPTSRDKCRERASGRDEPEHRVAVGCRDDGIGVG